MDEAPAGVVVETASVEGHRDEGHRGVAILLGMAAILATIVGVRATALSSDASDTWQSALRTEVKRSAGALADIRYLYMTEVPPVVTILGDRMQEAELRAAAARETGAVAQTLTREADVKASVVSAISTSYELATHPAYALPGGGVNLGLRLSDLRNQDPDLVALDPDALQAAGDALGLKAEAMTLPLLPIGLAALFGALAQPFAGRRRLLLALGAGALALGALTAAAVEVLV
ncbi:MAG TPA: hypothetical protein VIK13_03340 [Candidatus Limnocylindrales bacterium]